MKNSRKIVLLALVVIVFLVIWTRRDTSERDISSIQGTSLHKEETVCKSYHLSMEITNPPEEWSCQETDSQLLLESPTLRMVFSFEENKPYCADSRTYDDAGNLLVDSPCNVSEFYRSADISMTQYEYDNKIKQVSGRYENSYGETVQILVQPINADQEISASETDEILSVLKLLD